MSKVQFPVPWKAGSYADPGRRPLKNLEAALIPGFKQIMPVLLLLITGWVNANNFTENPEVSLFIEEMVNEHGFSQTDLNELFATADFKQSIIDAISRPAEKRLTWKEYQKIFLTRKRVERGHQFINRFRRELLKAEEVYGVPVEIIAAVIGVETFYGRQMGSYRVIDALSTLAFNYPARGAFFRGQLKEFLILAREEQRDARDLLGSYAGAMGFGQFIPSSYRAYAIDFDGDGNRDIWRNEADAIGSVANYLSVHGWRAGEEITEVVKPTGTKNKALFDNKVKPHIRIEQLLAAGMKLKMTGQQDMVAPLLFKGTDGEEFWVGYYNFYVITRYNHSKLYAMAVYQLSRDLDG